ncbi:hydroxymethylglutaryl-CoA synthase [Streptococcus sp. DD12]|uniref:hydroxymethylglutaryl-CoA synthase n=1 Tax=Streptococcus sp. DD12 TaxID=1777880 RepID=UPI0007952F91|nr:hydroxymethylglutaryl-CoA synthase [Streptococcus sp. DD12]KXT76686.1 Hydroxymethylglutaryl-CoA synthase [Streptococcus sp. DD12]
MTVGIDKIGFATSQYQLAMADLAQARGEDPQKYAQGLLLDAISIAPVTEDIVTLACDAAQSILTPDDKEAIDLVIVATESSVDQSKAAAIWVHQLLGLKENVRAIEMKEACYAATAALDYAKLHVQAHPDKKALVIASDIAKYGIGSSGEPTQGAGSIALLVSQEPRLLAFSDDNAYQTRSINDFWRPNYSQTPFVQGMYSTKQYLDSLKATWRIFQEQGGSPLDQFAAVCFHLPYPKLALKGLKKLITKETSAQVSQRLQKHFDDSIRYSQKVGNIYTGSLYLGLLSLLEQAKDLAAGDRILCYSYGSGAVSEMFSMTLQDGFRNFLSTDREALLTQRHQLSVADYEALFFEDISYDAEGNASLATYKTGPFTLKEISQHERIYGLSEDTPHG